MTVVPSCRLSDRRWPPQTAQVSRRRRLAAVLRRLRQAGVRVPEHLDIAFVDRQTIRRLHREYLHDPAPTDVLAFALGGQPGVAGAWAQVVISLDMAARQAKRWRVPFQRECDRYLIHGLLHVAGYDDHLPTNRRVMRQREDALLARLERA